MLYLHNQVIDWRSHVVHLKHCPDLWIKGVAHEVLQGDTHLDGARRGSDLTS